MVLQRSCGDSFCFMTSNDHSRKLWFYDQVPDVFMEFQALIERQVKKKLNVSRQAIAVSIQDSLMNIK